jgi:hypothetical protein
MKRFAKGFLWVKEDDPKSVVCHIPAKTGYKVIEGSGGPQILRSSPKIHMSKKERRKMNRRWKQLKAGQSSVDSGVSA